MEKKLFSLAVGLMCFGLSYGQSTQSTTGSEEPTTSPKVKVEAKTLQTAPVTIQGSKAKKLEAVALPSRKKKQVSEIEKK